MEKSPKGYRVTCLGEVPRPRPTCELKDCENWRGRHQGCDGKLYSPLFRSQQLGIELDHSHCTVKHRCVWYQPRGFRGQWYWPIPKDCEGGGYLPGIPEAVKMWLDAGLPEDFRLPGQERV